MTGNSSEPDVSDALHAYLDSVALVEPILSKLWHAAGITLTQLYVLHHLRQGPQPSGRIAQALGLSSASATRIFDRLEERGLISRQRNASDRRCVEIHLEPTGRRLVGETPVIRGTSLEQGVRSMTPEQRRRLADSLGLLVARVRQIESEKELVTT